MKNKYFILVLTFLCLFVGQNSYSQDWGDLEDLFDQWESEGVQIDFYDNVMDYVDALNHDSNDDNDLEMYTYVEEDRVGTTVTDWKTGIEGDYVSTTAFRPVENENGPDIRDGLLDTHNYDNDTGGDDDDQYPPGDPNNDNPPNGETPTPDPTVTKTFWYLDNDGDDYYETYVYAAGKPPGNYKESGKGFDCDDTDASKNISTDCGLKKWYLDWDGDGYHSDETESADAPDGDWILTTKGVDCEESDPKITTQCNPNTCKGCPEEKDWYLDKDNDGYDGGTEKAEKSPEGTGWKEGKSNGTDCDDSIWSADNLNCAAKKTWYLDNDNDGLHSQVRQAQTSPDAKWKEATSGVDCNDARYNVGNDCSTADPCAEIKNVLNYNTPGYADKNLKSNINRLKNVVNASVNKKEEGFEIAKRMNADETYRYEFDKALTGTEFQVSLQTGGSIVGAFHSHPSTGVPIYSFQDLRHLLHLYDDAKAQHKQDVFEGVVVKDAEGNANVYMLKVDNIDDLRDQVEAVWDHPDYARYTKEEDRIKAIHKDQAEIFDKSGGAIEKSFLEQFPTTGISIYKADASVGSFSKLTLNDNKVVIKTPCN